MRFEKSFRKDFRIKKAKSKISKSRHILNYNLDFHLKILPNCS